MEIAYLNDVNRRDNRWSVRERERDKVVEVKRQKMNLFDCKQSSHGAATNMIDFKSFVESVELKIDFLRNTNTSQWKSTLEKCEEMELKVA